MVKLDALKERVCGEVDAMRDGLVSLSKRIYTNPELGFQEHKAVEWLSAYLQEHGFAVEAGIAGLETAFRAQARGSLERPHVALLAEYDALPGLGHACGHNLICVAGVGAAAALRRAAPILPGTLTVLGTPAEEGGGGKVFMVDRGIFQGIDAAMMFHPSRNNWWTRGALAARRLTIGFRGRAAHAAAMPEQGINALNALLMTFHGIDALRQHVTSDVRIHGIVSHGGDAANIVPAFAEGKFSVRARTRAALTDVLLNVKRCAEAGALATGASVEFEEGPVYAERYNNRVLVEMFAENMQRLGVEGDTPPSRGRHRLVGHRERQHDRSHHPPVPQDRRRRGVRPHALVPGGFRVRARVQRDASRRQGAGHDDPGRDVPARRRGRDVVRVAVERQRGGLTSRYGSRPASVPL